MQVQYTFEIEDIISLCGNVEAVQSMDGKTADYLVMVVNNLIDQKECEDNEEWSQLHNLICELDGMRTVFALFSTEVQYGTVVEIQPIIIEALKKKGIL